MKTYSIIMLLFTAGVLNSCGKSPEHKSPSVQVTALVDITDARDVLPDAESLLSFYEFQKDKNTGAVFMLTTTTDKLLNPVSGYCLASGDETEKDNQYDDPDYREKLVLSFYSDIRQSVDAFNIKARQDTILKHSECFRSIAGALTKMKENKADKNLLAIYSDLGENSDLFSVYGKTVTDYLLKHPDSVIQKFEATGLLPQNLSGFTVRIIFQPKNRQEDQLFNAMATVYKKMLTARGAKVVVSVDNPISI
jgi:hypothetical protein